MEKNGKPMIPVPPQYTSALRTSHERLLSAFRVVGILALCAAAAGCDPKVSLQGLVTNVEGEPLPGVSVKVEAAQAFGVTNGNGLFGKRPNTVNVPPGKWDLVYIKSGFTTAQQQVDAAKTGVLQVPPVALWPLPAAKGVYILDGSHYRPLTRVTPDRHRSLAGSPVFGVKLAPELNVNEAPAYFISHKMANYDWRLSRLEKVDVLRPGVEVDTSSGKALPEGVTDSIWAEGVRLPIDALPIDLPERLLWRISTPASMGPGVYALHWGALDGDTTTEESAYLFGIRAPEAPEAVAPDTTPGATEAAPPQNG